MRIDSMRIRIIMADKGVTQSFVARNSNLSRQSINKIIRRGTCEPKTAGKLAAGLGVPVTEILAREGV